MPFVSRAYETIAKDSDQAEKQIDLLPGWRSLRYSRCLTSVWIFDPNWPSESLDLISSSVPLSAVRYFSVELCMGSERSSTVMSLV